MTWTKNKLGILLYVIYKSGNEDSTLTDNAKNLVELRDLIESLDKRIIVLLSARLSLAEDFAEVKKELGITTQDKDREIILHQLYDRWAIDRGVEPDLVHKIFDDIISVSRKRQEAVR